MALAQILILTREIDVCYRNSDDEKANDPCTCPSADLNYNHDVNNNYNNNGYNNNGYNNNGYNNNGFLNVLPRGGSSPSNHLTDNHI